MRYLLYILVFSASFSLFGQSGQAEVKAERSSIRIGEQINLELKFNYTAHDSSKIVWPEFDNYLTNSIEIINKSLIDSSNIVCDSTVCPRFKKQNLLITSFEPGNLTIPAIKFKIDDSSYYSSSIPLLVNTVTVDTAKGMYDVYPIYEVEYTFVEKATDFSKQYWHWFLIVALLIVIFILYKKYKNRPVEYVEVPEIIIPAHIKALETLNLLKSKKAWEDENHKKYHSDLTDAVRQYLEDRFEIQALEQTTSEIIQDLQRSDISVDDKLFLQKILQQADFVKFAKFKPTADDGLNALNKSFEFVNRTKVTDKPTDHVE